MYTIHKVIISTIFLVEALFVYFVVTQQYPISGDDYAYLYQAKLFANGKLCAEDPLYDQSLPFYDCLETYCLRDDQGRRFSKYPPGWPAILAVGQLLHAPWLVDPILGALLVFLLLKYSEQTFGNDHAKIVGLLVTLCFFLCYYAASFRAHIATALLVFGSFLLYEFAETRKNYAKLLLFASGALLGYSALIRYLDWVPLAGWISISLTRRKRFTDIAFFGIGFVLFASGNLLYNKLLSGSPFEVPAAVHHAGVAIGDRLTLSPEGLVVTIVRLSNLLWVFPPVLLLVIFWRRYQLPPKIKMFVLLFLAIIAIYFLYPASSGGPGPRYFLAYFPFLILAVAEILRRVSRDFAVAGRRIVYVAMIGLTAGNLAFIVRQSYVMYRRRDLERTVQQVQGERNIFLLETGTYKTVVGDLTRNPPALSSAKTLYFASCDDSDRQQLLKRFSGYNIFIYRYPGRLKRLSLTF